jgi:phosphatidylserine/phosphatidylglycerophosphate/cardiolipin synthase-like enzyme
LTDSANWTRTAAEANFENMIMTDDPRVLKPFRREFGRCVW